MALFGLLSLGHEVAQRGLRSYFDVRASVGNGRDEILSSSDGPVFAPMRRGSPVKNYKPAFPAHTMLLVLLGLLLSQGAGCDLGVYGNRYRERLAKLNERTEASRLLIPTYEGLSGLGLEIRLPTAMEGASVLPANNVELMPNRAQPPGITIPGLQFAREQFVNEPSGSRLSVYFYAAKVAEAADMEVLKTQIADLVSGRISDVPRWSNVALENLKGQVSTWETVTYSAAQPFETLPPGATGPDGFQLQTLEGKLTYYVKQSEGGAVLLVWRYPSQIADQIGFPAAIEASVGSSR